MKGAKLYDNCKIYNMDGVLMFRCNKKRIQWYLSRGLAERVEDSEGIDAIKLNFKPKGQGSIEELAVNPALNKCVCCGTEDLSVLTKHHIVPREFRTLFPTHMKNRFGFLIVPLCIKCHVEYETTSAKAFRKRLNEQASHLKSEEVEKAHKMIAFMNECKEYLENGVPLSTEEISSLEKMANDLDCTIDLSRIQDEYYIRECITFVKDICRDAQNKLAIEKKKFFIQTDEDIEDFCRMWVNDFLESSKPKFLPAYFSIEVLNKMFENIQSKLKNKQPV